MKSTLGPRAAAALLTLIALAAPAGAWYPVTTQVELGTATW